ncbi:MAG: arginase [Bacteroidia bacterium]
MKNIKLIEVKSEIGAGTRGASMGIDAIKIAALDFGSTYFKKYKSVEVPNENKLLLEPILHEHAKRINGVYAVLDRVSKEVEKTIKQENVFPIVLAGDHSTAAGTISGIRMAYPEKRLGVIWIDAHADIHSPYTTPSGNMHGMPIAVITAEDNLEFKVNNLDAESVEYWEKLKNIGNIHPKINFSDLIYIAVRDTEKQEEELIRKKNIRNFTVAEIRRKGVERVAIEALNLLEKCDLIYVSFDVDSMDSSISKGTGTPVKNGITEKEAGNLIARLFYSKKVCCFEIVEINPTLDKENLMAENAFEILLKATNQLNRDF